MTIELLIDLGTQCLNARLAATSTPDGEVAPLLAQIANIEKIVEQLFDHRRETAGAISKAVHELHDAHISVRNAGSDLKRALARLLVEDAYERAMQAIISA